MKNIQYIILAFFICSCTATNNRITQPKTKPICVMMNGDTIINTFCIITNVSVLPSAAHNYYWYYSGHINHAIGNYTGQLLHGSYEELNINNSALLQKGQFEYGIKVGCWQEWHSNGTIKSLTNYKDGIIERLVQFDINGDTLRIIKQSN